MSKKINLEYHPPKKSVFIDHLQKLEGSITDSHTINRSRNWEDLKPV